MRVCRRRLRLVSAEILELSRCEWNGWWDPCRANRCRHWTLRVDLRRLDPHRASEWRRSWGLFASRWLATATSRRPRERRRRRALTRPTSIPIGAPGRLLACRPAEVLSRCSHVALTWLSCCCTAVVVPRANARFQQSVGGRQPRFLCIGIPWVPEPLVGRLRIWKRSCELPGRWKPKHLGSCADVP
jgi:hypothetical protein